MKILHVNKFFWQSGGVERYMFEVAERLKREGHESIFFSMQHPNNFASEQSRYFVSHVEYRNTSPAYKARTLLRTVGKTIYSPESRRKMEALVRAERPDLAHIHLVSHQISPSVLLALKKLNVPVVQTVHEYKRLCPAAQFYIHHKDEICERCLHGNYFHATFNRCIKNSLPASALATVAQYVHKYSGIYENNIDLFVAPSRFMAEKLTEGGLPPEKLRVLGYTLDLEKYEPRFEPGDYAVFYGRISSEKGIRYLLDVARLHPDMRILVIGDGPQLPELKAEAKADSLQVEFPGHKDGDELRDLVRQAAFVVVPSQWYDNSPMVVYEAFALGKPVIATRIGGIPEMVDHEQTGVLVEPRDLRTLAEAMRALLESPERCEQMGRHGREKVEEICARGFSGLLEIYEEARKEH